MVYVNAAAQNTIVPRKYDNQTTLYCHKVYIATNVFNSVNTTALSQTDQLSYQGTVYYGLYNCKTYSSATDNLYKLK